MKQIVPEVYVKDCKNALTFYQSLFGGEIKNVTYGQDMELFQNMPDKIIHAELHINSKCIFYFVDIFDKKREHPGNITLVLHMQTKRQLQQVYAGLCQGGVIGMELQKTFWGEYHAIVTDRFGAPWALNYKPRQRS